MLAWHTGSALTLAQFLLIHRGIFMGRRKDEFDGIREIPY
jgi:hypothetical protein